MKMFYLFLGLSPMISAADVTVKEYDTEAKLGPILDDFFKNM